MRYEYAYIYAPTPEPGPPEEAPQPASAEPSRVVVIDMWGEDDPAPSRPIARPPDSLQFGL